MARGFYSVVQYVPDRFRAEAVNIGLVLLRLEPHAIRVRMTCNFDRARRLFRIGPHELTNLAISASGFKSRIENSAQEFRTADDLAAFAASRANDLRLASPRLAVLENFGPDFERLFSELVDDQPAEADSVNIP
ncbi:MAG: DUF3037 domain-containing protein [Thermoguttaceae bacterium]